MERTDSSVALPSPHGQRAPGDRHARAAPPRGRAPSSEDVEDLAADREQARAVRWQRGAQRGGDQQRAAEQHRALAPVRGRHAQQADDRDGEHDDHRPLDREPGTQRRGADGTARHPRSRRRRTVIGRAHRRAGGVGACAPSAVHRTDAVRRVMEIAGSAALVTGAASGLGAATAAALAARGATVYGLDLEKAVAGTTAPDGVTLLPADVTEEAGVREALARIDDDGQQLRLAVNCAGIAPSARIVSRRGPHDLDLFRTVVGVNLVGTFNVLRLAADAMSRLPADADGQRGVIVNTASIAAFEAQVGQVAYAASKAGVAGMTVTAARDLAQHGIRVMAIAPGIVDTPMMAGMPDEVRAGLAASVPFPQRLARPEEYARLVLMIAAHDYLNGETIRMDGALRMGPR